MDTGSFESAIADASGRAVDTGGTGAPRVLVVDDDPMVRTVYRRILERAGYAIVEASDGPDGIEAFLADTACWAAVVLDLTLPGLDGRVVLDALRGRRPDMPVVVATGWTASEAAAMLAPDPDVVYLEKPFSSQVLIDALRRALD